MEYQDRIDETVKWLGDKYDVEKTELAIILGSGLGTFGDLLENKTEIAFSEIPNFKTSKIPGHNNKLILGRISGKKIMVMQGRIHYYEGNDIKDVTFPIRLFKALKIDKLILTNAAGGLSGEPGQLMLIKDHLDLFCPNPLIGDNLQKFGERFPDMTGVYDKGFIESAISTGERLGIQLTTGNYCYLTGPSYETPFDIQVLKMLGVDAVGMSTVPEAIVGRHSNMKILGISCITNLASGISDKPLSHKEVVETTQKVSDDFIRLLKGIVEVI